MNRVFRVSAAGLIELGAIIILSAIGMELRATILCGFMAALFYLLVWESTKTDGLVKGLGGAAGIAAIVFIEWFRGVLH